MNKEDYLIWLACVIAMAVLILDLLLWRPG